MAQHKEIFKHDDAMRYINLFLKSEGLAEIEPITLKIVIEKLLQYLEVFGYRVKRK